MRQLKRLTFHTMQKATLNEFCPCEKRQRSKFDLSELKTIPFDINDTPQQKKTLSNFVSLNICESFVVFKIEVNYLRCLK